MVLLLEVEVENGYLGVVGGVGVEVGGCVGGNESRGKKGWWRMRRLLAADTAEMRWRRRSRRTMLIVVDIVG